MKHSVKWDSSQEQYRALMAEFFAQMKLQRITWTMLSEKMNISKAIISEYINGKKTPSDKFIMQMCKVCKIEFVKRITSTEVIFEVHRIEEDEDGISDL